MVQQHMQKHHATGLRGPPVHTDSKDQVIPGGWCAHIKEQVAGGRLIRPSYRYTGTLPEGAVASQMAG